MTMIYLFSLKTKVTRIPTHGKEPIFRLHQGIIYNMNERFYKLDTYTNKSKQR